jgi:hypothetical protein
MPRILQRNINLRRAQWNFLAIQMGFWHRLRIAERHRALRDPLRNGKFVGGRKLAHAAALCWRTKSDLKLADELANQEKEMMEDALRESGASII